MWRAAVPASYTILSVRSMPVAFCFRETRLRANLIPSFPSQVFSIQMIMIIHTTDGFTSRWPCLDCQIVPVFFKTNYDDVEWQEIMSRQLYGTYISISSIETIRKSRQKQRGANSFPVRVASQSIDAWKQTSLWNEKYWKNKTWLCVTNNVVQKVAWSPKIRRNRKEEKDKPFDGMELWAEEYIPFDTIRLKFIFKQTHLFLLKRELDASLISSACCRWNVRAVCGWPLLQRVFLRESATFS